jgi:hypothetical protein
VGQVGTWTVAATQSGAWGVGQVGTWTVTANQGGTWTVAATQSGAWGVGQVGTWTVTQSGPWTVAATQSGAWGVGQVGAWTVAATQSGAWTVTAGQLPAAVPLSDALPNPTTALVGAAQLRWNPNAAVWEREADTYEATLLSSAARTVSTASADQVNQSGAGVVLYLNVTVSSGTGGLQVFIQIKDPASGQYFNLNNAPTAITAVGHYAYVVYPSASAPGNQGSSLVNQYTYAPLPRTWRVTVLHGDASSYTYSVGASILQ